MAERIIIIDQPQGIGDLLYIQKIIKTYAADNQVIVPVLESIKWIGDYLPHPNVSYPSVESDFLFAKEYCALHNVTSRTPFHTALVTNNYTFVPLGSSYQALNANLMTSKYQFVGIDGTDWADHVAIKRDIEDEKDLSDWLFAGRRIDPYTLINEHCSSGKANIPLNGLHMQTVEPFTLFDWMGVIENASQIVTVDTALVLLCEVLKIQKPLHIVSRYTPPTFEPVKDILRLPWNYALTVGDLKL